MAIMEWTTELATGVSSMDEQHKILIGLMNRLHDENTAGKGKAVLLNSFKELASYTAKHFKNEEDYMESINYPDLKIHKMNHTKLLDQVANHLNQTETTGELNEDLFPFLKMWLKSHIKGIDTKYGAFANK